MNTIHVSPMHVRYKNLRWTCSRPFGNPFLRVSLCVIIVKIYHFVIGEYETPDRTTSLRDSCRTNDRNYQDSKRQRLEGEHLLVTTVSFETWLRGGKCLRTVSFVRVLTGWWPIFPRGLTFLPRTVETLTPTVLRRGDRVRNLEGGRIRTQER